MSHPPSLTPLTHPDALRMLKEHLLSLSPGRRFSEREERLLGELTAHLDGLPASITLVASALVREDVARVHTQITHGFGHLLFDLDTWGDAWERLDATQRQLLSWAAQCHGGFDRRAIEEAFGEDAFDTLTRSVERGLILLLDKVPSSQETEEERYQVCWSMRMCVQAHLSQDERRAWQHQHATYFLDRAEAIPNVRLGLIDYENLQGAILTVLPHDPELATRCCLSLIAGARHLGTFEKFIALFEKVIAIRPCTPGDLLGIELLGRLGELYRATGRHEESVEALELAIAMEPPLNHRLAAGIRLALATALSYIQEHDRALKLIHEATTLYTHHGSSTDVRVARTCHGTIAFRARDYVLATKIFEALVQQEPANVSIQSNMAAVYSLRGMAREGLKHTEEALMYLQSAPDPRAELILRNNAVAMELCEGRMASALEHVQRAHEIYEQLGTTNLQQYLLTLVNDGLCQLLLHNLFEAQSFVQRAVALNIRHEVANMLAIQIAASLGDFNTMHEVQARELDPSPSNSGTLNLTKTYIDLTIQLAHHLHGKSCDVTALQAALDTLDWSTQSCMVQLLFDHLQEQINGQLSTTKMLWVHEEGSWARRGASSSGELLDLRRSGVTRRLLLALVEAHQEARVCTVEELFEAAWPGQVWNQSARVRLHTAIHRLRDRLLDELLFTQDDEGYCLDPDCLIEHSSDRSMPTHGGDEM